jgi:hypothetical protein
MSNQLKMFYWSDVQALREYSSGEVIILARSLEEARESFSKEEGGTFQYTDLVQEILNTAPSMVYENYGSICIRGSA